MAHEINYSLMWSKWIALLTTDTATRGEILEALHYEVTKGLDVITRLAIEEFQAVATHPSLQSAKADIEISLASSAWSGYALFLIKEKIDPVEENVLARSTTNELGNKWMGYYEKDQTRSMLEQIDPIISLLLNKENENRINQLLITFPEFGEIPYKEFLHIETFHNWVSHQGYILGVIEQELHKG